MKAPLSHIAIAFVLALTTVVMLAAPASAQPTAIFVDDDFPGDSPAEHLWTTIAKGIADATPNAGDTIYVGPGTYNESIVVDVPKLTLQGYSSSEVVIDGRGAPYTVRVTAEDVYLRQFTIRGGSTAGVRWESVQKGYLESNVITGNYHGIWIDSLENQTIQCNEIYGNDQDGIYVTNSTMKDVTLNNIHSNGRHGIALVNSSTMTTFYNQSHDNDGYGIYVFGTGSTNNDIKMNDFYNNNGGPLNPQGYSNHTYETNQWRTELGDYNYNGVPQGTGYLGNYWSDHSGSDGGDGVIDTAYSIAGGGELDEYPLTASYVNYEAQSMDPSGCAAEESPPDPPGGWPAGTTGGGCFIATAAYGSYMDSHVETLRDFRDSRMETSPVGSALVSAYYKVSPPIAGFIDDHPALKPMVRAGLLPAVGLSTATVELNLAEKAAIAGSMLLVSALAIVWLGRRRAFMMRGERSKPKHFI